MVMVQKVVVIVVVVIVKVFRVTEMPKKCAQILFWELKLQHQIVVQTHINFKHTESR